MKKNNRIYSLLLKCLILAIFCAGLSACSDEEPKLKLDAKLANMPENLPEGSGSSTAAEETPEEQALQMAEIEKVAEGSLGGDNKNHPEVQAQEKIERKVVVPENVKGKWRAVKLLVINKQDEEKTEVKTIDLGGSFDIKGTDIKVTVGEFFPNFVMSGTSYSSMNNQIINPAVQLRVEQNGKILYNGWTFAKYPELYAFEHDTYRLELLDFIPTNVS